MPRRASLLADAELGDNGAVAVSYTHLDVYKRQGIINAVKDALASASNSNGALTGTADGFIGPITVAVTMDGDTITSVEVTSNSETIEIAGGALEQIPKAIVEANSPDVDVVSGATYTSKGIINAVKDALGQGA